MKFTSIFASALLLGASVAYAQQTTPVPPGTTGTGTTGTGTTGSGSTGTGTTGTGTTGTGTTGTGTGTTTSPGMGTSEPGANSFTEEQARQRILDAGYTDVTQLTKNANGIWQGEARKDGQTVHVTLDYKGDVSSTM